MFEERNFLIFVSSYFECFFLPVRNMYLLKNILEQNRLFGEIKLDVFLHRKNFFEVVRKTKDFVEEAAILYHRKFLSASVLILTPI